MGPGQLHVRKLVKNLCLLLFIVFLYQLLLLLYIWRMALSSVRTSGSCIRSNCFFANAISQHVENGMGSGTADSQIYDYHATMIFWLYKIELSKNIMIQKLCSFERVERFLPACLLKVNQNIRRECDTLLVSEDHLYRHPCECKERATIW